MKQTLKMSTYCVYILPNCFARNQPAQKLDLLNYLKDSTDKLYSIFMYF